MLLYNAGDFRNVVKMHGDIKNLRCKDADHLEVVFDFLQTFCLIHVSKRLGDFDAYSIYSNFDSRMFVKH